MFKEKYHYHEESDSFCGITSKHVPIYSDFIKFWETTVTTTNSESDSIFDNEIEIDELCSLFKQWVKLNTEENLHLSNGNISEENILKILKHFFPNVEIVEDKFVLNITCCLWNKILDINSSFNYIKENIANKDVVTLISFDDVYNYYYTFCNKNSLRFIVSKRYFEKYLYYKLSDHIVYDKFIELEWLNKKLLD